MENKKVKRLFLDVETAPNIGFFWEAGYKKNVPYQNIVKERAIICICYKWAGEKTVHSLQWDANQNDKTMLTSFIKIMNEADEVIGQNHERFDMPWIRTRCLLHKVPMFPKYTTLDTYKKAKAGFKFNSNSLNYIASFLGLGHKSDMTFSDWVKIVLDKDAKAMIKMIKYCKKDVQLLEDVYNRMSPYFTNTIHHGVHNGHSKLSCPECMSTSHSLSKTRTTSTGLRRYQLQCKKCSKYYTVSETTYNPKTK